jgi:hypothetical protein
VRIDRADFVIIDCSVCEDRQSSFCERKQSSVCEDKQSRFCEHTEQCL